MGGLPKGWNSRAARRWRWRQVPAIGRRMSPRASIGSRRSCGGRMYRAANTDVETRVDEKAARVDVTVRVSPGPRSILQNVVVEGADATKPSIARSIALTPGAPLDPAGIRETRQPLHDLDVPKRRHPGAASDGHRHPGALHRHAGRAAGHGPDHPRRTAAFGCATASQRRGDQFDERDRRLGFAADVENRNLFGRVPRPGLCGCGAISRSAASRSGRSASSTAASLDAVHRAPAKSSILKAFR